MPNPYPGNFLDEVELAQVQCGPGAVCLDLGGGGRRFPGVVSVDLVGGDVVGDVLRLPFPDDCAHVILSQAVLEHVTDPQRAVDEAMRVLRPGGVFYVEAAFMQPVHMAPHHYFNITPHGLRYLLRDWEVEWEAPVGTAKETLDWVLREYGMLHGVLKWRQPPPELFSRASCGVSALARKPV